MSATQTNASVFGYKDSIEMRLHYKETSAVIPQNKTSVDTHYIDTGGLNQFYFANGFKINKNLSVGLQASALFGSLIQNEVLNTSI